MDILRDVRADMEDIFHIAFLHWINLGCFRVEFQSKFRSPLAALLLSPTLALLILGATLALGEVGHQPGILIEEYQASFAELLQVQLDLFFRDPKSPGQVRICVGLLTIDQVSLCITLTRQ